MTLKEKFAQFNRVAPVREATVLGHPFAYRYYQNPDPKKTVTLVMLAGGSGLADGFFYLYDYFMPEYSLLSFSYPMDFRDNDSMADAIAALIQLVGAKNVYLMGQSYGGLIAQIIAKRHPEAVKGMILSGTCGLGKDIDAEGRAVIDKMLDPAKIEKNIKLDRKLPIGLLVPLFKLMAVKVIKDKKMRRDFKDIIDICRSSMSGEYFALMDTLLGDIRSHAATMTKEDFLPYKNEVLIFFSKEDTIFCDSLKQNLVDLMTDPTVVWDLKGGHLAMMVSIDEYVAALAEFIRKRNEQP